MCVGNTQHLQALSCFMKNAMLMIRLLASLCFSAISKGERGERCGFLQLLLLVVQEERGLLMSNGFERLWFPVSPLLTSAPHLFINLFHWTLQGNCLQKPLSWEPIIVWSGRGLVSLRSGNWGKAMDLLQLLSLVMSLACIACTAQYTLHAAFFLISMWNRTHLQW